MFNSYGLALLAPITQGGLAARENGFTITLMGSGSQTQGIINAGQLTKIDLSGVRKVRFIETLGPLVVRDALAKARTLLD